jgi:16S rRNA (guanine527-N7)-methyltransferase
VSRHGLGDDAADRLGALLDLLVSDQSAPTTVRHPVAVIDDHLADALVALEFEPVLSASTIADLGAGAGIPGLPLAIARPNAQVTLVESNGRKCAFLERAICTCGLHNARVVNARIEAWREGLGVFELVTARALAPLAVVAEYAAPLLRVGGWLAAWRGQRDHEAERAGARAAAELGLRVVEPRHVHPYPGASHRHLHLMRKTTDTPARFPRRPGVARNRPLGARPDASTSATGDGGSPRRRNPDTSDRGRM